MCRIFTNQEPVLQGKIHQMQSSLDMLHVRRRQLNEMRNAIPGKSQITYLDEQYYYASPRCSIDKTGSYNEVWETFYEDCVSRHVSQGYPVCYVIGTESLASGNVNTAKSIAFHVEDPSLSNLRTPGGMYATGYYPVPHASSREYDAMLKMIEQSQYHVAGDSIEEIICDEVYTKNTDDFMIRISIPVQS